MRNNHFKALILALAVLGLDMAGGVADAETLSLVQFNSGWKYFTNGTDLGTS